MALASSSPRAPVLTRPRNFEWCWKDSSSSYEPSTIHAEEWLKYTDVENEIIEDAYNEKQSDVELDGDRIINFTQKIQYRRIGLTEHWIRRVELERDRSNIHLREERYLLPMRLSSELRNEALENISDLSDGEQNDVPDEYSNLELWKKDKTITDVVEEAAQGIITEGTAIGKTHEAQWLSRQLLAVKLFGTDIEAFSSFFAEPEIPPEIGDTCVHLYTWDSFWYKLINRITRSSQKLTHEHFRIFGPFCWLLQCYLRQTMTTDLVTVYRGVDLTEDEREKFMKDQIIFRSFTSTTKNRTLAEWYGNTLLIIDLDLKAARCGSSIAHVSNFPEEEEFLIWILTGFDFVKYEYDNENQKHIIFLKSSHMNVPAVY